MLFARLLVAGSVLSLSTVAVAAEPCEAPRIRDTAPMFKAIKEDRALADAMLKTAGVCAQRGDACDTARLNCGTVLSATLKSQVGFDEGWWLRDMMLPYLGQKYAIATPFLIAQPLTDVTCNVDSNQLSAAAAKRLKQADRRQAILNEYPKYAKWANDAYKACKATSAAQAAQDAQQKAQAEKLAATAAAAKAAEEARQQQEAAAKKQVADAAAKQKAAEEAALRKQQAAEEEAARQQKAAEEDAARKQAAAQEQARREAQDAAAKAKADAEAAAAKAKDDAERARAEAEEKARTAEEQRIVQEREAHKAALRKQREAILAQAEEQAGQTKEEADRKRQEALARIDAEEAQAQTDADKRLERARKKAAGIAIDDSDERSRGAIALLGGVLYGSVNESGGGQGQAVLLGGQVILHFGIWGTAPAAGMAPGFELRLLGRFFQSVALGSQQQAEGNVSARYYFGPLGIGLAGEFRSFSSTVGSAARTYQAFSAGPSVGIAMVDNPHLRTLFSVHWLPVGSGGVDLARVTGDFEVSYELFTFDLIGGTLTDPQAPSRLGFTLGGSVGVRLTW